ncbi:hypothetical protein ASD98_11130 [Flavobacterium sp. Root186]|nr:hypothetical protein ASD98_11130 [Flavobacterium sp. Root186]
MIDMLVTFSKALIHVATAIDEAYYEGKENELEEIELSSEQKLELMDIDKITVCYQTTGIENFVIKNVEQILKQNYLKNEFTIKEVIVRKNCAYIKIMYDIPLNRKSRGYGTSFSINFMEVNNGVSVYGYQTKNANEKQAFKEIASELIQAVS